MRLVLMSGPGGAGTTTLSAATAAAAAATGHRVLVVGADPGLADVLGLALSDVPRPVGEGWSAAQVDVLARTEDGWDRVRPRLSAVVGRRGPRLPSGSELLPPPGAAELSVLAATRHWAGSGEWDVIVLDAGPAAQALRLVEAATALRWHLNRWLPPHHRATLSGLLALTGRGEAVSDLVARLEGSLADADAIRTDPGTSLRVVTTSGSVPLAAAGRLAAGASVHGLTLDGLVLNRADPHTAPELGGVLAPRSWTVPEAPAEPLGPAALLALGVGCYQGQDPVARPDEPASSSVEPDDDRFVLELPLPHVRRVELDLTRCGDDLILTVGGHRARHALGGVLTRCRVDGAELSDGRLRVWFRPDPAVWPDGLPLPTGAAR